MAKTNLPVLILDSQIVLPQVETRLEIKNEISKKIIKMAESFNSNHLLIVPNKYSIEKELDIQKLPKIGVVGKIIKKIDGTNNSIKIILKGLNRVDIYQYHEYSEKKDILEADIGQIVRGDLDSLEERALINKIKKDYEKLIERNPSMSNSLINIIEKIENIGELSDILALNLTSQYERLVKYMITPNPIIRAKMILEDIKNEQEVLNIEKEIDFKLKEKLDNNQKEFILRERINLIKKELGETSSKDEDIDSIKEKIKNNNYPDNIKKRINKELKRYEIIPSISPEISIARNYIDWLLAMPWEKQTKDNNDLQKVKTILDSSHFALDDVKDRIIEYLAVKEMSNSLKSPIICLTGPPGTGKTSLAKSIAKSLDRKFVKISVGGIKDEAEITGHRRTYIGANPGRIIQGIKKAGSNNPVFLIDEIDKMASDVKGDPTSSLLDILDPEQNKHFSDNYIEEEFDLSRVMFIATANYINRIPEPLKDRLEIIELYGYTDYEKLDIAKNHLIPKLFEEHGITDSSIIFREDAILDIIKHYTKEAGTRNLERNIAKIIRKIVTEIIYEDTKNKRYIIHKSEIKKYLGNEKYSYNKKNDKNHIGIANGLAYTVYGGDIMKIEVNLFKGKGNLKLTGSLGNVLKESVQIAISYLKANHKKFKIKFEDITENDIHIHFPEGAIPKDGPSAGIAITTALLSALTKKPIKNTVGMTGEITLRGQILKIGGLKHKSMGAYQGELKTVIIPKDNECDLDDIPEEIKSQIEFICVDNYKEILNIVFEKENISL